MGVLLNTEELMDSKNFSTAYVILYELTNLWVLVWNIILTASRATSTETRGLDDVFPLDDLCSRPDALC